MDILQKIIKDTRILVEERKRLQPLQELEKRIKTIPVALNFFTALQGHDIRIIAEVKQASPSRGIIRQDFDYLKIARTYAENGAAAVSVLTEPSYFMGKLDYISEIKADSINWFTPILRKDFIFDTYQVFESRAYGADSLLLIAAILDEPALKNLLQVSRGMGMEPLVEIHNTMEIEMAVNAGAEIIGINNRDLATFNTDIWNTERLRSYIPAGKIIVSESGIHTRYHMELLQKWGVDAALIGEAFMSAEDIKGKMQELQ